MKWQIMALVGVLALYDGYCRYNNSQNDKAEKALGVAKDAGVGAMSPYSSHDANRLHIEYCSS